ncbi:type II toxin-antitoxin system HicB family antitoxin [Acetobacterium sp. UBA5834]|jgi:predicted RNase H-like HicB family nuclease|uniref:type II toxin-antitoxin system HicB family antitoxin n=1 Tax=Acetobacterium sp. UBA5834 TaxID=1945907 RepID=UPI0025809D5A|nr:type II toxin-antitoxin system HicB family antitoxin [Acetobacterium sp. UBA5834]
MRKLTYLAVLEPTTDGYGVYFPDLPGCISFGKDIEDSQQMAKEALELHIYGMEKDNDPIPEPSRSLDKEDAEAGIITAITVLPDLVKNDMENRRVKTNVTIPAWLKDAAESNHVNYSKLLEAALIDYLNVKREVLR